MNRTVISDGKYASISTTMILAAERKMMLWKESSEMPVSEEINWVIPALMTASHLQDLNPSRRSIMAKEFVRLFVPAMTPFSNW